MSAPFFFYIRGVFGDGDYRHQDTVFKFWLQAWLLLGTASACGALVVWSRWNKAAKIVTGSFVIVPLLCSLCVIWTRAVRDAPRDINGNAVMSLDGSYHLPIADREALRWLQQNVSDGDTVLEAVAPPDGPQAYSPFGRVASLSGIATPLGWPQHLRGWGASEQEITKRRELVKRVYQPLQSDDMKQALQQLGVRYVFVGDLERQTYPMASLSRLHSELEVVHEHGDTFIAKVK